MAGNRNSGRKPQPTALKILRGNPGKRAINDKEPKAEAKLPIAPKWLTGEARKQYNKQGKRLVQLGILKETDGDQWAMYCHTWQLYIECIEKVKRLGPVLVAKEENGVVLKKNQYMVEAHRLMQVLQKLAPEFGLTPSSRSKIGVPQNAEEMSEFAKLLHGT